MGERQRGDKPETLLARNAKLASNAGAPETSSESLTNSASAASSNGQTTGGLASSRNVQVSSSNAIPSAAAASSIARTTTGSNGTPSAKAAIGNASSGSDVWNGAPTTMATGTASHANKLALNPINDPARPTDAAVSN
jgi:hypothetical protein